MSDTEAVAAALARLVNGTAPTTGLEPGDPPDAPPPRRLVAEAEAALEGLPAAAEFVADGGERRLRHVLDQPIDDGLEERGCDVLSALERLRAAADPDKRAGSEADGPAAADHFHLGHTTLLKGHGVPPDR